MSATHLTRIEREAKEYAETTWQGFKPSIETSAHKVQSRIDYKTGANREKDRAAPVVNILTNVLHSYGDRFADVDRDFINQILETYKADV